MRGVLALTVLFLTVTFAGCIDGSNDLPEQPTSDTPAGDDAVVIAVVDSRFNPYHHDFRAALMPQHLNDDPSDDLPLDKDPGGWLRGHPGAAGFATYQRLDLNVTSTDDEAAPVDLYTEDEKEWKKVERSTPGKVHMTWIPDSKVVGYVNMGGGDGFAASSHGTGTTSVSVGNIHGACPECLLVFVNGFGEAANEWVESQDWIDLQTNSYGLSLLMRDRLYAKTDLALQREAVERGQQIFFSAGNGQANTFTVPNPTLWSSQEGPDWIVTVGAISPNDGSSYSGHGKPSDIASIGGGYPSMGGATITAESTFGGTSNATPVTAGTYGRALYLLRREMADASRTQTHGTISTGDAACGTANADCALADGKLTVHELRTALFLGAQHTDTGWSTAGVAYAEASSDMTYMAQGHGSLWGRLHVDDGWWTESDRIAAIANGTLSATMAADEVDWFIADSYCRQNLWGTWDHGDWNSDVALPPADPVGHPVRSWLTQECPNSGKLVHQVVSTING